MRIALDIRYHTASGASNYIANLVGPLMEANSRYELVLMRFADQDEYNWAPLESIICPRLSIVGHAVWDQGFLPRVLARNDISLYHPLKFLGAMFCGCPRICMGHSITSSFRGEFPSSRKALAYWATLGNHLYRRSTHIIAVSEYVREFLIEVLSIPQSRITVVYNGKDERFRVLDDPPKPPQLKMNCDAPFLLGVGNMFPVKNHLTTVLTFAALAKELPDHSLVIAGNTSHKYFQRIRRAVDASGVGGRVHFPGFVDGDSLLYLYNRADVLLMPSLTEGCPITLLEAMACGLPVIGSNRGGITELGGEAIVLVDDPHDVPAWTAAVREVVQHAGTRARMARASVDRAAGFNWVRTAAETLAVYDAVLR